jgi:hypothetical protein
MFSCKLVWLFTVLQPVIHRFYPHCSNFECFHANLFGCLLFYMPLHLYGDVTIAGEGLQNLGLCSALCRAFKQGGVLTMPHLLWHGTSVIPVSSEGSSHSVASYDTDGDVEDLFLPSSSQGHGNLTQDSLSPLTNHSLKRGLASQTSLKRHFPIVTFSIKICPKNVTRTTRLKQSSLINIHVGPLR